MSDAWMDNLRVVLVRARNPLNIGAAARAMSNFGLSRLRLVTPWEPSYHNARSAVGAGTVMDGSEVFSSVAEAVADCALVVGTTAVGERELQHPLPVLEEGAEKIRHAAQAGPVAILFGSEKTGLANAEFSHCHFLMRIPTRAEHISMNLGQAVAICVYEIARGSQPVPPKCELHPVPAEQLERLTGRLGEALAACGYQTGPASASESEKLRRLVHRLALDKNDTEILLGMLRQMIWKMKS